MLLVVFIITDVILISFLISRVEMLSAWDVHAKQRKKQSEAAWQRWASPWSLGSRDKRQARGGWESC